MLAPADTRQRLSSEVVNVASVPKRSPFRYPGGKTWLIPRIRDWLGNCRPKPREIIEPFAGGGIVSLTGVFEDLVERATMVEIDGDIASVWHTILNGRGAWLADRIWGFDLTADSVKDVLGGSPTELCERAFATIIRNRISRGGIIAPGAGVVKNGENGKGLGSRWYPGTLRRRILEIVAVRDRFLFLQGDGLAFLRAQADREDAVFFIDPPYCVAGRRLYTYGDIDHQKLFGVASELRGDFLMTYDSTPYIRDLAVRHGFAVHEIPMKTAHHTTKCELLIGRDLSWAG